MPCVCGRSEHCVCVLGLQCLSIIFPICKSASGAGLRSKSEETLWISVIYVAFASHSRRDLGHLHTKLLGDVLLAAGQIAYLGPFTAVYR